MNSARPGESSARPSASKPCCGAGVSRGQHARGERQRGDPDRQVDEEDPAPGDVVDEIAAEDRAQDRAEQHRDADDAHHAADAAGAGGAGEDRHAERHQHAAAEPLEDAEADQRLRRPGDAREQRAGQEEGDREQVQALGAEAVGGPAGERDHGRQRERVAGDDPLDRREGGVEVTRQRGDRDVDDRGVEDRHHGAEHHDGGDGQEPAVERGSLRGGGDGGHGERSFLVRGFRIGSSTRSTSSVTKASSSGSRGKVRCGVDQGRRDVARTSTARSPGRARRAPSARSTIPAQRARWVRSRARGRSRP